MPSLYYVYPPCGRLSNNASEVIDLLTLIGTVVGMITMGHLADRVGRKKLYGLELAIIIVATMGVVQASEGFMVLKGDGTYGHSMDIYAWIPWWRFSLGFGIGAEYPMSAIITAEWASTESRGTMLASVFAMQSFGRMLAFATSLGAVRDSNLASFATGSPESKLVVDGAWRLVIGVGAVPAALAIVLRLTIPETPRYHVDIMKDLRKAVRNALRIYGRNKKVTELNLVTSSPSRQNSNEENDHWFRGAWKYLVGPLKPWRNLITISLLWGIMDVAWYGLSLDSPSAFSTLVHNPSDNSSLLNARSAPDSCTGNGLWNTDPWDPTQTIDKMLVENSIRSICLVSVASLAGSITAIFMINRFRRSSILVATFLLLSVLFAIGGGTLIGTYKANESHLVTTVFYAILQFVFNLGPNTLIFVLAAEMFPTVYRGTFYGIAAAWGKVGAITIRAVIQRTGNNEKALGIRLLVFVPLMLVSAWISWYLPEVQHVPSSTNAEVVLEQQTASGGEKRAQITVVGARESATEPVTSKSDKVRRPAAVSSSRFQFLARLKNKTLEEIAPNPSWDRAKAKEAKKTDKKKQRSNEQAEESKTTNVSSLGILSGVEAKS